MITLRRLSLLTLAAVTVASALPLTVEAQQNTNQGLRLTTSPLPISLTAKPGQTVTTELRIRNSSTQNETLEVGLLKFSADGLTGVAKLAERQPSDDYFDWVTFSDKQFTLTPNQ